MKMRLIAAIGAYNMLLTAAIPTLTMMMANATYEFPAIRTTLTEVLRTRRRPMRTEARGVRKPPTSSSARLDMLAVELKMDPARHSVARTHSEGSVPLRHADGRGVRLWTTRKHSTVR